MGLHEIKVGYVGNTDFILKQIAKDKELVMAGYRVTWDFFSSVQTGTGGPSFEVRTALQAAGIQVEEHNAIAF